MACHMLLSDSHPLDPARAGKMVVAVVCVVQTHTCTPVHGSSFTRSLLRSPGLSAHCSHTFSHDYVQTPSSKHLFLYVLFVRAGSRVSIFECFAPDRDFYRILTVARLTVRAGSRTKHAQIEKCNRRFVVHDRPVVLGQRVALALSAVSAPSAAAGQRSSSSARTARLARRPIRRLCVCGKIVARFSCIG